MKVYLFILAKECVRDIRAKNCGREIMFLMRANICALNAGQNYKNVFNIFSSTILKTPPRACTFECELRCGTTTHTLKYRLRKI